MFTHKKNIQMTLIAILMTFLLIPDLAFARRLGGRSMGRSGGRSPVNSDTQGHLGLFRGPGNFNRTSGYQSNSAFRRHSGYRSATGEVIVDYNTVPVFAAMENHTMDIEITAPIAILYHPTITTLTHIRFTTAIHTHTTTACHTEDTTTMDIHTHTITAATTTMEQTARTNIETMKKTPTKTSYDKNSTSQTKLPRKHSERHARQTKP
ncbi:MAG: hypothetical protein ACYSWP_07110 [Planctomycetota bacterium]